MRFVVASRKKDAEVAKRGPARDRRAPVPLSDVELPRLTMTPVAPEIARGRRIALTIVVVLTFLTVAWIASPLWVGIALGTVMAFTAQPAYRKLAVRMGDRRAIAAAITTVLSGIASAIALSVIVYILVGELFQLVALFQNKLGSDSLAELVGDRAARALDRIGIDRAAAMTRIRHELSAASESTARAAGTLVQATTSAMLGLVIALMTMYYVLLEWPNIAIRLERVLPLDPRHTRALVLEFRDVGRSSFVGTVATALVQGLLGGVGYAGAGLSNSVSLGLLTTLASFVPLVGTSLVWVGASLYLLFKGNLLAAILVSGWGFFVVMGLSDYFIRPRLVGGHGHGHPLLMLVALLGGIEVFGLAGLIAGPIVMSLFLAALRIYEREVDLADLPDRRDAPFAGPAGAAFESNPELVMTPEPRREVLLEPKKTLEEIEELEG
ncbi:AI-2E family transporter [Pendulispora albinea]|uniref:AI-2E family transporter n=1 Tax=Pendulispora albinea TaxID=2741071 RepID=A0ABZ2LQL6_9BACT